MNRALLIVNLVLVLVLSVLIHRNAHPPRTTPLASAATAIRRGAATVATDPRLVRFDDSRRATFVLDFGAEMVAPDRIGKPADPNLLALAPAVPLALKWVSATAVEGAAMKPLAPASTYEIVVAPELKARDGRTLTFDAAARPRFETARPRLERWSIEADAAGDPAALALEFNQPIAGAELRKAASITLAGGTGPIETPEPKALGSGDLRWAMTLPKGLEGKVRLHLAAGLASTAGKLPMGKDHEVEIDPFEPLTADWATGSAGCLSIRFNKTTAGAVDRRLLKVEPALPFVVSSDAFGVRLFGAFKPGATYVIELGEGFPGRGKYRLAAARRLSVRVEDTAPRLEFADTGTALSALAEPEITLGGVNVGAFTVTARRVYPNNVVHFLRAETGRAWHSDIDGFAAAAAAKSFAQAAPPNEAWKRRVDLAEVVGARPRGIYLVGVEAAEAWAYGARRIVQVTDLAITARVTGANALVHVRSIARGEAVECAFVRLLSSADQVLGSGVTGPDGTVIFPLAAVASGQLPAVMVAEKGDDAAFLDLETTGVDFADVASSGRAFLADGVEALVQLSRGVVRPGETIEATVLVRDRAGRVPEPLDFEARWHRPDGVVARREPLEFRPGGLAVARLAVPAAARVGGWRVDVAAPGSDRVIGSAALLVDCFVPETMETTVALEGEPSLEGEAVALVSSRCLDGGSGAGRPARLYARFRDADIRFPNLADFSFAPLRPGPPVGDRAPLETALDDDGAARLRILVPPGGERQAATFRLTAEVVEPSGRPSRAAIERVLFAKGPLVGIRSKSGGAEIVAVDTKGEPWASPVDVLVQRLRCRWDWLSSADENGRWSYETRLESTVAETRNVRIENGRAAVDFAPMADDWSSFTAYGVVCGSARAEQAPDGSRLASPERVRIQATGAVDPGAAVKLAVDAPFAGRALVSIEGRAILSASTVTVERGRNEVVVRVPGAYEDPNLHIVVSVFAPQAKKDAPGPFYAAGAVALQVRHEARRAPVALDAPERVRPGAEVLVRVDAPGSRTAVLALVDEGILRLTGHAPADPHGHFQAPRRMEARGADTGVALLSGSRYSESALAGGDDDGESRRLSGSASALIRPTALFAGPIVLDANGRGEIRLTLPPFEGRLRADVVVAGDGINGAATRAIVVSGPIGIEATLPRFLEPGDEAIVPVTVKNRSGARAEVRVTLDARHGLEILGGRPEKPLTIEDGRNAIIDLRIRAGAAPGVQGLGATAQAGREIAVHDAAVPVRSQGLATTERIAFATEAGQDLVVPGAWAPGARGRIVLLDGPDGALLPALAALVAYPHGCLEQTTSRASAVLACRSLLPKLSAEGEAPLDADAFARAGVDRILSFQLAGGGLSLWEGGFEAHAFGSVYALDFLLEAKERGLAVPAKPLERLIQAVERRFQAGEDGYPHFFAAEALSRAERPIGPFLERLESLLASDEDRYLLALAYHRTGRKADARRLVGVDAADVAATARRNRDESVVSTGGGVRRRAADSTFGSALRARAVELRALLATAPAEARIASLVLGLTQAVARPNALTTQESAQALRALVAYFDAHAPTRGKPTAVIVVDGKRIGVDASGRAVFTLSARPKIRVESARQVFGALFVEGYRTDPDTTAVEGLAIDRVVIDEKTGEAVQGPLVRGGVYRARIKLRATDGIEHLLVTDLVPGGLEIDPQELPTGANDGAAASSVRPARIERRDDRVLFYFEQAVHGTVEIGYRFRAVFPGTFGRGRIVAEPLYEPGTRTVLSSGPEKTEVKR